MSDKQYKKHALFITKIISLLLFVFVAAALSRPLVSQYRYYRQKQMDLKELSTTEYNGIFCSMYPTGNFSEDDFATYRGLHTLIPKNTLQNLSHLEEYVQTALSSGNSIETIYLGLDPEKIWNSSGKNLNAWMNSIQNHILDVTSSHPEITFEILLPSPSLTYWIGKKESDADTILTVYQSLIDSLEAHTNIITFFLGGEYWLIGNPANYIDPFNTNRMISQKMFLFTFCDGVYEINSATAQTKLASLRTYIQDARQTPTQYPDLSHLDIVFFGDSIIGNYTGSSSVPGAVAGLTNARTYNCGIGGASASVATHYPINFPVMADAFVTGNSSAISNAPTGTPFQNSLERYLQESHTESTLCFVLNYGLNDYINGLPISDPQIPEDISTYAGGLRHGINLLQHHYPEAVIVVMAPTFITSFSCGTNINSEKGSVLTDYVDTARMVAEETDVIFMNNYQNLGINEDNATLYLSDTIHLNETGRFLLAQHIIEQIASVISQ